MTQLGVTNTSTVSEPRTAETTTTDFPRFLDGAAFAAYGPDARRRRRSGCWYLYVDIRHAQKRTQKRSAVTI